MLENTKTEVRYFSAKALSEIFPGTSELWWAQRLGQLCDAGVLKRRGRKHFGTVGGVEEWLTGRNGNGTSAG